MGTIKKEFMSHYLSAYKYHIEATTKASYIFLLAPFASLNTTNQLGGASLLAPNSSIPRDLDSENMVSLAQIDFSEVKLPTPFPAQGILQFYVNKSFGDPNVSTDTEQFAVKFLKDKPSSDVLGNEQSPSPGLACIPTPLKFTGTIIDEPVSVFDYRFNSYYTDIHHIISADEQSFLDIYTQSFLGAEHKIGGYPYFISEDFRQNNTDLQKYDTLLLQIITDDLFDIEYRDSGIISFFIEEKKLLQLDFSDVYMHTEHY